MQPGEAAVFHLTQTVHEIAQGGLTLVLLRTKQLECLDNGLWIS
jgi:hypothetical protein